MGATSDHMPDARPWHRVYVDGFWMDKADVTNEQFARFVKATGYVTAAERKPRAEDYPGAIPDKLVDEVALVGPKERILDRLKAWKASPTKTMLIGTNSIETVRILAEACA